MYLVSILERLLYLSISEKKFAVAALAAVPSDELLEYLKKSALGTGASFNFVQKGMTLREIQNHLNTSSSIFGVKKALNDLANLNMQDRDVQAMMAFFIEQ